MSKRLVTAQDLGRVAVLLGGHSAERDVSLQSGEAVCRALEQRGVDLLRVDPAETDVVEALRGGCDRVFNILHGRGGEDGVMQGLLEILGLPYTGSGVLGSALAMDKLRCKQLWQSCGLPTPSWLVAGPETREDEVIERLGLPLMVKPAREGSSIGMSKVSEAGELRAACELAWQYDDSVIIEAWIEGNEYTVSILDGEALPAIRLHTPHLFYDYNAKYEAETTEYLCPCGLDGEGEAALATMSLQAFTAIDACGWGRVDLMMDAAGQTYLIEANTLPGMTSHSLVPMAAKAAGMDFDELVWRILLTTLDNRVKGH
jgi:D-alanine-D-alanine ligase